MMLDALITVLLLLIFGLLLTVLLLAVIFNGEVTMLLLLCIVGVLFIALPLERIIYGLIMELFELFNVGLLITLLFITMIFTSPGVRVVKTHTPLKSVDWLLHCKQLRYIPAFPFWQLTQYFGQLKHRPSLESAKVFVGQSKLCIFYIVCISIDFYRNKESCWNNSNQKYNSLRYRDILSMILNYSWTLYLKNSIK